MQDPTKETTTSSLPAEPNDFVGRERDVDDLLRMLANTRTVTLCGPGGIGKTRLALRLARVGEHDHPDGVHFVELADTAAVPRREQVAGRVAAALRVAEEPGRPLLDTLADVLRPQRTLLVLDNCEHLLQDCAELAYRLLSCCPELRLLVTSREPLRMPGENIWRVPPLAVPDAATSPAEAAGHEAVVLFLARATAVRADFELTETNLAAVIGLCRDLDGLPLALELAAARTRVLAVEQIAERLADRFRLLSAGDRTAPPRQRTLRAAIDWSHDLLTEPEQILLRRLSVFAGCTLDQAERVCADDLLAEADILDVSTALVDKSLVAVEREVAGRTRFRLLDSIRSYAAERLAAAGEGDALRDRHREAVLEELELDAELAVAGRPGTWAQRIELFHRYDHDVANVRAALEWCVERRSLEEGMRLSTAMRLYHVPRGYFSECEQWARRFAALGRAGAPPGVLGSWLVARAELAIEQRDFERAGRLATEGLPLCRRGADAGAEAGALHVLGVVAASAGRFTAAAERLEQALAVARAAGDAWAEGMALIAQGSISTAQHRFREAQSALEAGLRVLDGVQQLWGSARALICLGVLARLRGDHPAARRYFEQALPTLRGIGASPDMARCLGGIGRAALATGDLPHARAVLTENLLLTRATGLRIGVVRALDAFAELVAREGDLPRAVRLAAASAALREALGPAGGTAGGTARGPARGLGGGTAGGGRLEAMLEPLRRRLGEQRVAVLWAQGRELGTDDAVEHALADPGTDAAPPGESVVPPIPVTPPTTLTAREREIVALVARGLSNRAIADELVISPATVARHVTNVLTKLGFTSRAQIAAWTVDRGPLGPGPSSV